MLNVKYDNNFKKNQAWIDVIICMHIKRIKLLSIVCNCCMSLTFSNAFSLYACNTIVKYPYYKYPYFIPKNL